MKELVFNAQTNEMKITEVLETEMPIVEEPTQPTLEELASGLNEALVAIMLLSLE